MELKQEEIDKLTEHLAQNNESRKILMGEVRGLSQEITKKEGLLETKKQKGEEHEGLEQEIKDLKEQKKEKIAEKNQLFSEKEELNNRIEEVKDEVYKLIETESPTPPGPQ